MAAHGIATSASGGAGVAAVLDDELLAQLCIDADARVLCIVSEGPDTEAAA
jgi:diaminopropionate ammonia-lyase